MGSQVRLRLSRQDINTISLALMDYGLAQDPIDLHGSPEGCDESCTRCEELGALTDRFLALAYVRGKEA